MSITKRLRELKEEEKQKLRIDDLLSSREFGDHANKVLSSMVSDIRKKIYVDLRYHNVAATDGNRVFFNPSNEVSGFYKDLDNAFDCAMGILFHEIGHIRYLDFNKENLIANQIKAGILPWTGEGEMTDEERFGLKTLQEIMADPRSRRIIEAAYHEMSNIISDPHDEDKMMGRFGKYVRRCILLGRHVLWMSAKPLELMEGKKDWEVLMSMMLQYARFQKISVNSEETFTTSPLYHSIESCMPYIDAARLTDDQEEKADNIVRALMILAPYLKKAMSKKKDKRKFEEGGGEATSETGDPGGSGASDDSKNETGGNDGSEDDDSDDADGSKEKNTDAADEPEMEESDSSGGPEDDDTDSTGSDKSEPEDSDGSEDDDSEDEDSDEDDSDEDDDDSLEDIDPETIEEILKAIMQASADAASTAAPENETTSKAVAEETDTPDPSDPDEVPEMDAPSVADSVADEIAKKTAEEKISDVLKSDRDMEIKRIDAMSDDPQKPIVEQDFYPTMNDIAKYEEAYKRLAPCSKRLQRKVQEAFREMKESELQKHRQFGKSINPKEAYRVDQKFFVNKKAPQDMPTVAVSILVDLSGSMGGTRIEKSREAAILLHDFAKGLGFPVCVCGHTYNWEVVYRIFLDYDSVKKNDKYNIMAMRAGGENRDGTAIEYSAEILAKRDEDIKLLYIISDGQPSAGDYYGEPAAEHIRNVVKKAKRKGVEVIACAIASDKDNLYRIYKDDFLNVDDLDALPLKMAAILKKRITA